MTPEYTELKAIVERELAELGQGCCKVKDVLQAPTREILSVHLVCREKPPKHGPRYFEISDSPVFSGLKELILQAKPR